MGRSYTPKYKVEVKTNLTGNHKVVSVWETKSRTNVQGYGRPNEKNLGKWVERHDESFQPNGCNFHVTKQIGVIPYVQEARIVNQQTGEVIAIYKMAMFQEF